MRRCLCFWKCWIFFCFFPGYPGLIAAEFESPSAGLSIYSSEILSLDGQWLLATDPENAGCDQQWWRQPRDDAQATKVPWIIQDAFPGYHGVAWYWRELEVPAIAFEDGQYLLRFWAVDYKADVWVNGIHVGTHEGSEDPFVLDVTGAVKVNDTNLLAVRVLNPTNEPIDGIVLDKIPHRNKVVSYKPGHSYNHGGITDSVELILAPAVRIEDLFVRPDPKTGNICIQINVHNAADTVQEGNLVCTVAPATAGSTLNIGEQKCQWQSGDNLINTSLQLEDFRLWNLNDPYQYRVTVQVQAKGSIGFDEKSTTCGFRDFRFENGYFRLNGKRIFLRSSHSGNHCPIGLQLPHDPDLLRRDLLNLKVMGLNIVRFSAGVPTRYQLDLCDEIGLMVWDESYGGWYVRDSSMAPEYFNHSTKGMIKRDRNHASVVIWGLLNENFAGPMFWHAVKSLPMIRELDDTRMVMLNTGRHDQQLEIGPISNPGSMVWERVYDNGHPYRRVPHSPEVISYYRTLGSPSMPYFMSEYGIGSAVDLVRVVRWYEQLGAAHVEDCQFYRDKRDLFLHDWKKWRMTEAFGRPEDYFRQCLTIMGDLRKHGINIIRSNPNLIGYGVTGAVDQGMSGEGLTTTFREFKPGTIDAIFDALAPLRWCLFVEPVNVYRGTTIKLEAVLANEDVLSGGDYPVRLEVFGPESECVYRREITINVPDSQPGREPPFAQPVFEGEVAADWPTGKYRFVASFERGGAAAGGEAEFYVADAKDMPAVETEIVLWGKDEKLEKWLKDNNIRTRAFDQTIQDKRSVILVSSKPKKPGAREAFQELARQIGRGSTAVFLSPEVFRKRWDWAGHTDEPLGWLPLKEKGKLENAYNPGIYRPDTWIKVHPIFEGLPCGGLLDYTFYRDIVSDAGYVGTEMPSEAVAGSINTSFGYWSGLLVSVHKLGSGKFVLNTLKICENLDKVPAAERMLRNMLRFAARDIDEPAEELPQDFDEYLKMMGL